MIYLLSPKSPFSIVVKLGNVDVLLFLALRSHHFEIVGVVERTIRFEVTL